jgi:hypothetical protein
MPAPTLTSISPNVGGISGGAAVTLTGTNFTGATGVTIGGVACTSVVVVSATSITCVTPAGSAGDASVVVTTPDGSNGANTLWRYLPTGPAPLYIYFIDGGVAHITDTWTGAAPQEEGLVHSTTGALVGTAGTEVGKPFRNIFPSTKMNPAFGWSFENPITSGGARVPYWNSAVITNGYPNADMALSAANVEASKSRLSDEVAGTQPRHFLKVCTWLIFLTTAGNTHKVRKDLVKTWGSKPPID